MYNNVYYIITVNNEGNKNGKKKLEREKNREREKKISFSFQISYLLEQHWKYNRYEQTNGGNLQQ